MKVVQSLLLAALVLVLAVIAVDLHRLTSIAYSRIPVVSKTGSMSVGSPTTREQRIEAEKMRLLAQQEDFDIWREADKRADKERAATRSR